MMQRVQHNALVVVMSTFIALAAFLIFSFATGTSSEEGIAFLIYYLAMGMFVFFVPFFLFYIGYDFLYNQIIKRVKFNGSVILQMVFITSLMLLVIGAFYYYDMLTNFTYTTEQGLGYLNEFGLFIAFAPISVIVNHFMNKEKHFPQ